MKENPSLAGTGGIKDSTSNANNGTDNGTMDASDQINGQIDGSLDFDGSDDRVTFSDIAAMDFAATSDFTISGWFNSNLDGADRVIMGKAAGLANTGWIVYTDNTPDDLVVHIKETGGDGGADCFARSGTIFNGGNLDKWFHFTFIWDDDSQANTRLYINGVDDTATACSVSGIGNLANVEAFYIGTDSSGTNPFNGSIDEVRVSNTARSADWIKTEYTNQSKPSTFYSVGGLQKRN